MKKVVQKIIKKQSKEKYVTEERFDAFAISTARRFDKMDARFDKMDKSFETLIKGFQIFQQEAQDHRAAMSALTHGEVNHERKINELFERVEKLEKKVK